MNEAKKKSMEILDPTITERTAVMSIIKTYIKENKRKIYGGYAHNKLVYEKNSKDAFYKETDIPDIDFFNDISDIDLFGDIRMYLEKKSTSKLS